MATAQVRVVAAYQAAAIEYPTTALGNDDLASSNTSRHQVVAKKLKMHSRMRPSPCLCYDVELACWRDCVRYWKVLDDWERDRENVHCERMELFGLVY